MSGLPVQLDPFQLAELADLVADRLAVRLRDLAPVSAPDRWMNTRQAAEYVGMHPSEVQRAAAVGAVPHEQDAPGCALRFRVTELDAWVRDGRPGLPRRRRSRSASMPLPNASNTA